MVTSVIIGARTQQQLIDNLKATDLVLGQAHLEPLVEASAMLNEYPRWMLEFSSKDRLLQPSKP